MTWIKLIGFCILAAAMVMVLRQMNPQAAGLLSSAFGVLLMTLLLPQISGAIGQVRAFLSVLDLDAQYFRILLKTMGIMLITQFAAQVCADMDAPSIAGRVEFCGRIALLSIAVPVFVELTEIAVGVLR